MDFALKMTNVIDETVAGWKKYEKNTFLVTNFNYHICSPFSRFPHDSKASTHFPRILPSDRRGYPHRVPPFPDHRSPSVHADSGRLLPLHVAAHHPRCRIFYAKSFIL